MSICLCLSLCVCECPFQSLLHPIEDNITTILGKGSGSMPFEWLPFPVFFCSSPPLWPVLQLSHGTRILIASCHFLCQQKSRILIIIIINQLLTEEQHKHQPQDIDCSPTSNATSELNNNLTICIPGYSVTLSLCVFTSLCHTIHLSC